jgi:predicted cation transporter
MVSLDSDSIIPQIGMLVALLTIPIVSKRVEHNIEYFFLAAGIIAVSAVGMWSLHLLEEALLHPVVIGSIPIGITQVVLAAGLVFYYAKNRIYGFASRLSNPYILASIVFALGIASSIISAIVASVILAELLALSRLARGHKVKVSILAAYAIGIGAALLPLGEPLSTIAIAKLKGEPYNASFTFLLDNLWDIIIPLIALFSILAYISVKGIRIIKVGKYKESNATTTIINNNSNSNADAAKEYEESSVKVVVMRAVKIYAFIFGLTLLGEFFKPLAEPVADLGVYVLYFFGLISAAADNATLTAALVSPSMSLDEIRAFITSLVIAGGMLIPGNVPNIVFASIIGIRFKEWARIGVPIGMPVFLAVAILMLALGL